MWTAEIWHVNFIPHHAILASNQGRALLSYHIISFSEITFLKKSNYEWVNQRVKITQLDRCLERFNLFPVDEGHTMATVQHWLSTHTMRHTSNVQPFLMWGPPRKSSDQNTSGIRSLSALEFTPNVDHCSDISNFAFVHRLHNVNWPNFMVEYLRRWAHLKGCLVAAQMHL